MSRLLLALAFTAACGTPAAAPEEAPAAREDAIINGTACEPGQEPTSVAILVDATISLGAQRMDVKTVICTGTLIAPDVVLTAAHCVDASSLAFGVGTVEREEYYVTFESDLSALAEQKTQVFPSDAIKAAQVVKHPEFSLQSEGQQGGLINFKDIGLVFLSTPVLDRQPEVVISIDESPQLREGSPVRIVGWGQQTAESTGPFQPPPAGTVGKKFCADSFVNRIGTHEMQIGAGQETSRKCHGDSGGPSFFTIDTPHPLKRRVVGITSHAFDQEDCAKGGVDTRVDAWLPWIEEQMTTGCDAGVRSWCEVKGILPADYFEPVPQKPTPGGNDDEGGGGDEPKRARWGGCDTTGGALAFALLGLLARRRRR